MGNIAQASVTNISFSNEQQNVAVGVSSDKITIQANDKLPETGDLYLTTSSFTGQFSSNSTDWQLIEKVTMSKNTANRTVYYKDSTAGNYTLTARLVLRTSGTSWTATQPITVGSVVETATTTQVSATTTEQTASTTTEIIESQTALSAISAHDSALPTSDDIKIKLQLVADAGRERIAVTHAPITFSSSAVDQAGKKVTSLDTVWSFGDGTTAHGENIEHAYGYPGDYVVIMNTQKSDLAAVDRTLVHVAPAQIMITHAQAGIQNANVEIFNQGKTEVNLARWSLASGMNSYVFPRDTIILAGKHITLPYSVTKLTIEDHTSVVLLTPGQETMHTFIKKPEQYLAVNSKVPAIATSSVNIINKPTLADVRRALVALEKKIAPMDIRPVAITVPVKREIVTVKAVATSSVPKIITVKKPTGFFANIMSLFNK